MKKKKTNKCDAHPWLSGGVEPKKNPTASLGGLSDIMPREFRPLPWTLKLPGNSRCLWMECCLELPLFCFVRELEFPGPSQLLPPVEWSSALKFNTEASSAEYPKFSSLMSLIGLLCLLWDFFDFSSCKLMMFKCYCVCFPYKCNRNSENNLTTCS